MINYEEKSFLNSEIKRNPTLNEQKIALQLQKIQMQIDLMEFKKREAERLRLEKAKKEEEKAIETKKRELEKQKIIEMQQKELAFRQIIATIRTICLILLAPFIFLFILIYEICKNAK